MSDALIVIDAQNGFTKDGKLASPRCRATIGRVRDEVERARERGDHLIFTADTHRPDDPEFQMFPEHCVEGTREAEIVDELHPYLAGSSIVRKRRYSAFHGTELDRIIGDVHPGTVTVVGFCTDICVLHTVADLRNRDLAVRVVASAVETFESPEHDADATNRWALEHMRSILGAEVVS